MESKALIHISGVNSGIGNNRPESGSLGEFLAKNGLLANFHPESPQDLVVVDYLWTTNKILAELRLSPSHCHLLRLEPDVVLPANYSKLREKKFGTIITVGGNPSKYATTVPWPQDMSSKIHWNSGQEDLRLDKVVIVNGNKLSLIEGELYGLRRDAISRLEALDLFGTSWDMGIFARLVTVAKAAGLAVVNGRFPRFSGLKGWFKSYPQWKGPIGSGYSPNSNEEKLAIMSKYKYALVIENSIDYMSEKLFDAFFAGCIPIYVGPDVENYGIPSNLVVQATPSIRSIMESIEQAKGLDLDSFQLQVREYLTDDATRLKWNRENVYKRILDLILERP